MHIRLGDILVDRGVLTARQRDEVLEHQRHGSRPFGVLAEELFGVQAEQVEHAWASQFAGYAEHVDPRREPIDPRALARLERRQAWQFRVLPLRYEGDTLVCCTTVDHLVRALRFTGWRVPELCRFVLTDAERLGRALMRFYPIDGMSPEAVAGGVAA